MIRTDKHMFSTLRLLTVPAGADPGAEPLLSHAGVLIDAEGARPAWDGLTGVAGRERRFLTTTTNDLTGPELSALANRLGGRPAPLRLPETSAARVALLHEEAARLLAPDLTGPDGP